VGEGDTYLIATNAGAAEVTATLPLPGERTVEVLFGGRTLPISEGRLTDTLAPLAVHVYRAR